LNSDSFIDHDFHDDVDWGYCNESNTENACVFMNAIMLLLMIVVVMMIKIKGINKYSILVFVLNY